MARSGNSLACHQGMHYYYWMTNACAFFASTMLAACGSAEPTAIEQISMGITSVWKAPLAGCNLPTPNRAEVGLKPANGTCSSLELATENGIITAKGECTGVAPGQNVLVFVRWTFVDDTKSTFVGYQEGTASLKEVSIKRLELNFDVNSPLETKFANASCGQVYEP